MLFESALTDRTRAKLKDVADTLERELHFRLRAVHKINDDLLRLVSEYEDYINVFLQQERALKGHSRALSALSDRLRDFLDRVGQSRSQTALASPDFSDDEFFGFDTQRPLPGSADAPCLFISDDDLESHAPDSPTFKGLRVKEDVDGVRMMERVASSDSSSIYFSPTKRKANDGDMNGTPSRRRVNSSSSPVTPSNRPAEHSGATEKMRLLLASTPMPEVVPFSFNGSVDRPFQANGYANGHKVPGSNGEVRGNGPVNGNHHMNGHSHVEGNGHVVSTPRWPHNNKTNKRINDWDPEYPLSAPPADEALVEVIPRNPYQGYFNSKHINYYVQWELERHVQEHEVVKWDDFQISDFRPLLQSADGHEVGRSTQDSVPLIRGILQSVQKRTTSSAYPVSSTAVISPAICSEMDREERSILAQDGKGLGSDDPDWSYGGKLVFAVAVSYRPEGTGIRPVVYNRSSVDEIDPICSSVNGPIDTPDNPFGKTAQPKTWPFKFKLCQVDQPSKSTRLARRFGSRRILTIRFAQVPKKQRSELFFLLRGRALVLFGRVYRLLFNTPDSEATVFVQTDESPPDAPDLSEPTMPSYEELLEMFNSLEKKPGQAMAKWAARTQLLLSDSIPALRVDRKAIAVVPDIVCDTASNPTKPLTVEVLTDGCGLMSEDLAFRIRAQPAFSHLTSPPYAIQMRIGGAKGVLTVMSDRQARQYPGIDIVLRDSMVKSWPADRYESEAALFCLDVLRVDGLRIVTNLSSEPLIILEHNGVPRQRLLELSEQGLEAIRHAFYPKAHPGESQLAAHNRLIAATHSLGGVAMERKRQECVEKGQSTKVAGLTAGISSETAEPTLKEDSAAEKLYQSLLAGFKPTDDSSGSNFVASKLRSLVQALSNKAVNDFKVPVEQSATAFIVPDAEGILGPDEIFVAFSSEQPHDPVTQRKMLFLQGECLLFRFPCKLPTDVRKMTAVVKRELFHLRDCIVMSADNVLCKASPASFLGGGDYDGDTATVIWDQSLVVPFTNSPDRLAAIPPNFLEDNFVKQVVTVEEFQEALDGCDELTRITNLQHFLMASMLDEQLTGKYSGLHDVGVYTKGCAHPETMRLAHMFCHVLDARKSGLTVPREVLSKDSQAYSRDVAWRLHKKGQDLNDERSFVAVRPPELGTFIMDAILDAAKEKQTLILADFPDPDRKELMEDFTVYAEPYKALLAMRVNPDSPLQNDRTAFGRQVNDLDRHVRRCFKLYGYICRWQNKTSIPELYKMLCQDQTLPQDMSRTAARNKGKEEKGLAYNVDARIQALAIVWRDGLRVDNVPLLVFSGRDDILRELKISCAIYLQRTSTRGAIRFPFEMDLPAMCAMRAQLQGDTRVFPASTARALRPTYRLENYTPHL